MHNWVLKFAIDSVTRCLKLVACELFEYSLYLEVIVFLHKLAFGISVQGRGNSLFTLRIK